MSKSDKSPNHITTPKSSNTPSSSHKKVDIKAKLQVQAPTKKKALSYLDKVDELITSTDGVYFDVEIGDLVIKKMEDKVNSLNRIIHEFGESNKDLNNQIQNLIERKKILRNENAKLKKRVNLIIDTIANQANIQFSGLLNCIKSHPGTIEFPEI